MKEFFYNLETPTINPVQKAVLDEPLRLDKIFIKLQQYRTVKPLNLMITQFQLKVLE